MVTAMDVAASVLTRKATPADAEELTRLRGVMQESMGFDASGEQWRAACAAELRRRLAGEGDGDGDFVAFVVEQETPGRLAAGGVGIIRHGLPAPGRLDGRSGYVSSMCTDEAFRGRGYATAIMARLLEWFTQQDITTVDLHATPYGIEIYRRLGFTEPRYPALTWHR